MTRNEAPHACDRWRGLPVHRWPTALGVAVAILTALDLGSDAAFVSSLSALIVLMALVYVGGRDSGAATSLVDRAPSRVAGGVFLPQTSWVNPLVVLLTAAAAFLVLGAVRGQRLWKPGGLVLQAAGFFVFGAIGAEREIRSHYRSVSFNSMRRLRL